MSIRFNNLSAAATVNIVPSGNTLSAWFYVENTSKAGVLVDSTAGEYTSIYASAGNLTFESNGTAYSQAISLNTWTHVAVTTTGNIQRSYVNGLLVDTSFYTVLGFNFIELDIGTLSGSGGIITIQDVVLSSTRLLDRYISQLAYLRTPRRTTGVTTYFWPMFADCGDKDFSGNGLHLSNAGSSAGVVNAPAAWAGDNTVPVIRAAKRVHAFGGMSTASTVTAAAPQVLLGGSLNTTSALQGQPVQHISGSLATVSTLTGVSSFTIVGELFGPWRDETTPNTPHAGWLPEAAVSVALHAAWRAETDSSPAAHAAWLNETELGGAHAAWATELLNNPTTHDSWLTESTVAGSAHTVWATELLSNPTTHDSWLNEVVTGSTHTVWTDPVSSGSNHGLWTNENSINGGAHTVWQNESIVGTVNLHTAWSES